MASEKASDTPELDPITGRVKWFDATRGFGFLVSDDVDGDVLGTELRQLRRQAPARGNDERAVPGAHQRVGDFEGGTFDAACLQCREQLRDGQPATHAPDALSRPG